MSEGDNMLTKSWAGTFVMSLVIGATTLIAAQAPVADAKGNVTIAGCLQGPIPQDEYALSLTPDGPVGTTGATLTYRLTNVTTKAAPATPSIYMVVGAEKQLTAHLGHQVEIVGPILKTQPVAPATSAQPVVRVTSVRMVSAQCGAT